MTTLEKVIGQFDHKELVVPYQSAELVKLTNLSDWSGSTNMFVILTNGLLCVNLTDTGWFILTVILVSRTNNCRFTLKEPNSTPLFHLSELTQLT